MRVVNNVEQEMIKAEWENWLLDENARCKQVEAMLQEKRALVSSSGKRKGRDPQQILATKERGSEMLEAARAWHEDYCGSCKIEQKLLQEGRAHLAFG